jgi:hypothetical protein
VGPVGSSHFAARRRKNVSEPIVLKLWARRHALGAFRPGQIAVSALAVLGAEFLLIDEIKGGDLGSSFAYRRAKMPRKKCQ